MGEGQRLIFSDGTTIEGARAGYADGFLWCYFSGYSFAQAASVFLDPARTAEIVFEYGEMQDRYEGFTECTNISADTDGTISVCMKRR